MQRFLVLPIALFMMTACSAAAFQIDPMPTPTADAAATDTPLTDDAGDTPPPTPTPLAEQTSLPLYRFDDPGAAGRWALVNDTVMGGVSDAALGLSDAGTLVFNGAVSLENNGGFASMRSAAAEYGIEDQEGIRLVARGDGQQYYFQLYTYANPNITYEARFQTVADEWTTIDLPFGEFAPSIRGRPLANAPVLDPATIGAVGIMIRDYQEGPFLLEVASMEAYAE